MVKLGREGPRCSILGPLLRAMGNAHNHNVVFENTVKHDVRKPRHNQLSRASETAGAPAKRHCFETLDHVEDRLRHAISGVEVTILLDVFGNALKITDRGVGPIDAPWRL